MKKLIIQIPCYNEEETLGITLSSLPRELPNVDCVEWLIVNDVYSPVMFTGRRLFSGYGSFILVSGYSYWKRSNMVREVYETNTREDLCEKLINYKIDYITIEQTNKKHRQYRINHEMYEKNFKPVFSDTKSKYKEQVYSTKLMCN